MTSFGIGWNRQAPPTRFLHARRNQRRAAPTPPQSPTPRRDRHRQQFKDWRKQLLTDRRNLVPPPNGFADRQNDFKPTGINFDVHRLVLILERLLLNREPLALIVERLALIVERLALIVERLTLIVEPLALIVDRLTLIVEPLALIVHGLTLIRERLTLIVNQLALIVDRLTLIVEPLAMILERLALIGDGLWSIPDAMTLIFRQKRPIRAKINR